MRPQIFLIALSLALALPCLAADEVLLWPNGAPGSEGKTNDEVVKITGRGEHVVTSVNKPTITVFLPAADQATGAAVMVAPGGGHSELEMDYEGNNVGQWLAEHGIAAFVLKYRLAHAPNSTYTVEGDELADMQRAIRLVRSRATEWGVNPNQLGVLGFSAGGELAYLSAMRFDNGTPEAADPVDRQGSRPNFQALIYPGNSGGIVPTPDSPPVFLACGNDDRPDISEGLASVYLKFKQVKVAAELHIYAGVGHGFGFRTNDNGHASKWVNEFYDWLKSRGFLKKS